jgi:hypothetical protein
MAESLYPPSSRELAEKRRTFAPETVPGVQPSRIRRRRAAGKDQAADCGRGGARDASPYCIKGHTKAALRHGATRQELMEAIWVAAHAALSLMAMDEAENRPDG